MIETLSEPPYGWWTTPDLKMIRAESADIIPATITEADVIDHELELWRIDVTCEDCGAIGEAVDMTREPEGAWICWTCHWRDIHERQAD